MGYFLDEVNGQGQALRAAREGYQEGAGAEALRSAVRLLAARPVLFTGMGSSWAAGIAAEAFLVREGRLGIAVEASEALYRWLPLLSSPEGFAAVLISQSGESPEVAGLARSIAAPFVAMTNNPESALGRLAAVALPLYAGAEKGVTNQTFLNSVAVAALLSRALLVERNGDRLKDDAPAGWAADVQEAAAAVDALLGRLGAPIDGLRRHFAPSEGLESWDLIGRGSGLAAVEQGALLLRELTGRTVAAFSGGLYRHGPVYRASAATRAIVLASREEEGQLQARLARDIVDRGGRAAFIADFAPGFEAPGLFPVALPRVAPGLFPIAAMIPLELLAIADLAARGLEPDLGVPKVTPIE